MSPLAASATETVWAQPGIAAISELNEPPCRAGYPSRRRGKGSELGHPQDGPQVKSGGGRIKYRHQGETRKKITLGRGIRQRLLAGSGTGHPTDAEPEGPGKPG